MTLSFISVLNLEAPNLRTVLICTIKSRKYNFINLVVLISLFLDFDSRYITTGRLWARPLALCTSPATYQPGGWAMYFPSLWLSVFIYKMSHVVVIRTTKRLETLQTHSKCHIPFGWSRLHPAVSFADDLACLWEAVDWFYSLVLRATLPYFKRSWGWSIATSFATFQVCCWKCYVSMFNF